MKLERCQQIDKLLREALERQPGQDRILLEQACAGDEELRAEVNFLLEACEGGWEISGTTRPGPENQAAPSANGREKTRPV